MRYSLVKVLLTVSPVRPSFLQPPAVHPSNHRFFTPLFSISSELLFSQLLCFHIYLRCPIVFFSTSKFPDLSALCPVLSLSTLLSPTACRLFLSLASLFSSRSFCFQWFAASFPKTPGVGGTSSISTFRPSDLPTRLHPLPTTHYSLLPLP